jgi:hypothetical protein
MSKKKVIALLLSIILIVFIIRFMNKETLLVDEVMPEIEVHEVSLIDNRRVEPRIFIDDEPIISREIGSIIAFGGYDWLILDIDENRAKIISVSIIKKRAYHDTDTPTTWATSNIRRFLNNDFYNSFCEETRANIVEITLVNENNQWYGINGGESTVDKIFLLSISEAIKYFGDSNQLSNRPRNARIISDEYNDKRIAHIRLAKNTPSASHPPLSIGELLSNDKTATWWWLRSPGSFSFRAAKINYDGSLDMSSTHIHDTEGGIRPVMWIDMRK